MRHIYLFTLLLLVNGLLSAQSIVPYLQAPTSNSMWITWYTTSGTESKVLYGASSSDLSQTATGTTESLSSSYILHHVQLTGLTPNTPYFYKVVTGTQESTIYRFVSAPAEGTKSGKLHYIVYGDTQDPTAVARVAPKVAEKCSTRFGVNWEDSVRFVVKLGDNVDVGGDLNQWKNLHFGCVKYVSPRIPTMTVPGNHEYYSNTNLSNYFAHTKYENINYGSIARADGEHYYAWQYANMLFVMFNSNETWTRQTDWVRNVITNANSDNTVDWVFAASHHPNFVEQYPSDGSSYVRNNVVPELIKSPKIAAEYSGHSHLYSRGAHKEAPLHQIINGGSSWIQRWGQDPNQQDYEDVQKTIDHYLFQIVTMDLDKASLYTETYSNGTDTYVMDNYLIDSYTKKLGVSAPAKPTISTPASITLPYTFQAGAYSGLEAYNSTEFQIVEQTGAFSSPRVRVKRDYEDIYLASNPNTYSPIDQNAGVDIFKLAVSQTQLTTGNNKIRVRFRDKNMNWSAWSDSVVFNVTNGVPGPSQNSIATYPFNNNTNDESGAGRNAVNSGITFTVDNTRNDENVGVFNNNAFADIATGTTAANGLPVKNITVVCWVNTNTVDAWGGFIGNVQDNGSTENGWVLGTRNNQFSFALRSTGATSLTYLTDPATFTTGQWYQVVGTYDGTTQQLFVNGQLKASSTAQSGNIVYPSTGWFTIGRYKDSDEDIRHDGKLDNIQLWERTLTNQEILNLYTSSFPQPLAEFVADKTTITVGESVTFSNNSHNSTSYSWSFPGGTPTTSILTSPVITYNTPGQYDVILTATGAGGPNTQTKTKLITVNGIAPSVSYTDVTKNYGDVPFAMTAITNSPGAITYSITSGGSFANIDPATGQVTILGAGTVTVQVTQAASGSYAAITKTATLTINKATLTATADNKSRVYNTANPAFTISYAGFVNGDNSSVVTGAPATSTTAIASSNVGTYPITLTGGSAANYTITLVNGTLTIIQATPTLTYTGPNAGTVGSALALSATTNSTATPTYSASNGTGTATLVSSNLTLNTAGTVTVTVSIAANGNYAAATINQTITINNLIIPTITFNDEIRTYGDEAFIMAATTTSPSNMTFSITSGSSFASIDPATGQVTILGAGTVTVQVAQAASGTYAAATQTATLTINKATPTLAYTGVTSGKMGSGVSVAAITNSDASPIFTLVNGTGTATLSGTTLTLGNTGTVTIIVFLAATSNYNAASIDQQITISSLPNPLITITPITSGTVGQTIVLDATTNSTGAISYSVTNGTGSAILSNNQLTFTSAGTITLTVTVASDGNFASGSKSQDITINTVTEITSELTSGIFVYPTIVENEASIEFRNLNQNEGILTITDMKGIDISRINYRGESIIKLNTEKWKAGMYLIHFTGKNGKNLAKIIKQ